MKYARLHPIRRKLIATAVTVAGAVPKLAVGGICAAAMVFALGVAAPAQAQVTVQIGGQEVPGFSNDYPWFNDVPQYQGDQSFRWFLENHPDIAGILARNPGLLYNANWRSQFPALEDYMANHPYEWQALNGEYWSEGPAETQWGGYDGGQWRDAYWWHQNNPNWFYDNHASWASLDSRWLNEDGAYDPQHRWHYGEWWYNQNPTWVTSNHPNWLREHQNWERPAERQNYRQQHAMLQENQQPRNFQQPAVAQQPDQRDRQQNEQRAIDQRQASLQQQASREQLQATHEQNQQALRQQHDQQRQANLEQQQTIRQDNQRQQQMNRQQNHQQQASREQVQVTHVQNQQAHEQQSRDRQASSAPQHRQENAHQDHANGNRGAH